MKKAEEMREVKLKRNRYNSKEIRLDIKEQPTWDTKGHSHSKD